jgi:toxin CcdB
VPQFAIFQNPGRNTDILFVVQLQSTRLDRSIGRVVMPLIRRDSRAPPDHPLTPHLTVQGSGVYANPLNIATVPVTRLKDVLEVLSDSDQDLIIRSIDEMISRA